MLARIETGLPPCWTSFKGDICIWDFVGVFCRRLPYGICLALRDRWGVFSFLFVCLFCLPFPFPGCKHVFCCKPGVGVVILLSIVVSEVKMGLPH